MAPAVARGHQIGRKSGKRQRLFEYNARHWINPPRCPRLTLNHEAWPQRFAGGTRSAGNQGSGKDSSSTMRDTGSTRRASGLLEPRF